jgi:hypothetical protein
MSGSCLLLFVDLVSDGLTLGSIGVLAHASAQVSAIEIVVDVFGLLEALD